MAADANVRRRPQGLSCMALQFDMFSDDDAERARMRGRVVDPYLNLDAIKTRDFR